MDGWQAPDCRSRHWRRLPIVVIALLGAIATYIDNYYTESVGQ